MGTLAGVEMGLRLAGVPHRAGGLDAAMAILGGDRAPAAAKGSRAVELA
jgi:alanine-glyoxylate transaminase / serine-glyoxylate transaminase / serine-pyruvate transaminase